MKIWITIDSDPEDKVAQVRMEEGMYHCTDYGYCDTADEAMRAVRSAAREVAEILMHEGMKDK